MQVDDNRKWSISSTRCLWSKFSHGCYFCFRSLHSQMFKVGNCSNLMVTGRALSFCLVKELSFHWKYLNFPIWAAAKDKGKKTHFGNHLPVFRCLKATVPSTFCAQYKNSVSVDERSQTLALGIMVKLMWLDRILYSAGIEVIQITYGQYWQASWGYLWPRVGRSIYWHTLCLVPEGPISRAEIDIN